MVSIKTNKNTKYEIRQIQNKFELMYIIIKIFWRVRNMWHSIIMPESIKKQFCYLKYYLLGDFESNKPLESNLQSF